MEILAVFSSRSEAIRFAQILEKKRIARIIISTPMHLGLGCGLSVCFSSQFNQLAQNFVNMGGFNTFVGFYKR
ncbi:MAG: DUF3343 domain-containing protein [Clostridia bacterium]